MGFLLMVEGFLTAEQRIAVVRRRETRSSSVAR
jgi:hypothetical protein